jgi:hypothetical protein
MPLSNHMEDLINSFINRNSAIENTKLTLETLWNVIAPATCKSKTTPFPSTNILSIQMVLRILFLVTHM